MIRATLIITMLALATSMDYSDEQNEADEYTSMVCAGHWPDYDNRQPECKQ